MNTEINALISIYKQSFTEKAQDFEKYYQTELSEEHLKELFQKAHKLAGSAKSYGFPIISEQASTLADAISKQTFTTPNELHELLKFILDSLRSQHS